MRVVLFLALGLLVTGCDTKEQRAEKRCVDSGWAWTMAQKYVRNHLKSPSSAKFDAKPIAAVHVGGCTHAVVGEFEAKNSFGAVLRQRFSASLTYNRASDTWTGEDLHIQ